MGSCTRAAHPAFLPKRLPDGSRWLQRARGKLLVILAAVCYIALRHNRIESKDTAFMGSIQAAKEKILAKYGLGGTPYIVGPNDLLLVGCGKLGQKIGVAWKKAHPDSTVTGVTRTTEKHDRLKELGIEPITTRDLSGMMIKRLFKKRKVPVTFPYVVFSPPPRQNAHPELLLHSLRHWAPLKKMVKKEDQEEGDEDDAKGDKTAAEKKKAKAKKKNRFRKPWKKKGQKSNNTTAEDDGMEEIQTGGYVFCSSAYLYTEDLGGTVNENSPLFKPPYPQQPNVEVKIEAEKKVLFWGGTVMRMAGLYDVDHGPHKYWFKVNKVRPRREARISLLHHDDAAAAVLLALEKSDGRVPGGNVFLVGDDLTVTPEQIIEITREYFPDLEEPEFEASTEGDQFWRGRGKALDTKKIRNWLGWLPKHASFVKFMSAMYDEEY